MTRHVHSPYYCMLFFLYFIPMVFSQLPEPQHTTMTKLSKLISLWQYQSDPNPCSWKGVSCSTGNTSINHLSLSDFGLTNSTFLPEICQIDTLQSLDLSMNSFPSIPTEFITNCGKINGLKSLKISRNKVSGPLPDFQGFVKLESLDLAMNDLSGRVGLQLDGLVGLKSLNLSLNDFTGSLPSKLGRSLVLEELQLSRNWFTGVIPEELFRAVEWNEKGAGAGRSRGQSSVRGSGRGTKGMHRANAAQTGSAGAGMTETDASPLPGLNTDQWQTLLQMLDGSKPTTTDKMTGPHFEDADWFG